MRRISLVSLVLLASCASSETPSAPSPYAQRALAIAAEYPAWGRVDDELRWAPFLCRLPLPGVAYMSDSTDAETHGQKLYSVFVKNRDVYPLGPHGADQVVVKESWTAERVTTSYNPEAAALANHDNHFYPYAKKGDAVYRAAARAGLYLMFRTAAPAPDTDQGWVYATLTADGRLTASGRIDSCIGCHEHAPHDRLFGVPKSPVERP
jgi:hypothetical protein